MSDTALVTIFCADRTGLVAAVTARLFDLGVNLGDTSFAVLGAGAEFTSICELPAGLERASIESELRALPELEGARIEVAPFGLSPDHGPAGHVTHRIVITGGDQPGLVARLSEVFVMFNANIVRLGAERVPGPSERRYVTRFDVFIPPASVDACIATIANTAGELKLSCAWEAVQPSH